jgi:hypothetical protein
MSRASVNGASAASVVGSKPMCFHFAPGMSMRARRKPRLRGEPGQLRPFRGRDQQIRVAQHGDPADVVLVLVGDDGGVDVGGGVAEGGQLGVERLVLADVEPGEPVVDEAGEPAGEVGGVGDRGAVLPGVEQQQPAGVFDHVNVDRPWRQPPP